MRVSIRRPEDDLVGPCDARGRSRFPPHASLAPPVFSKPRDAWNVRPDVVGGNEPRALELPWRILVTGAGVAGGAVQPDMTEFARHAILVIVNGALLEIDRDGVGSVIALGVDLLLSDCVLCQAG